MFATRRHRRLTVWIALLAMLAFALVPTLSRALAPAQGASTWAEICTPQGMRRVALADGDPAPTPASPSLDHCAFCGLSGDGPAPLPAAQPRLPQPPGCASVPSRHLQASRPQPEWRRAQARAPPSRP